jgi:hypothetical protein
MDLIIGRFLTPLNLLKDDGEASPGATTSRAPKCGMSAGTARLYQTPIAA